MLDELVLALVALNLGFCVFMLRILAHEIRNTAAELDNMLAGAIQNLVDRGIGNIEPINPIQQAIAQMLSNNIQGTKGQVVEVDLKRDESGKFT